MVKGLEVFREHFKNFEQQYVLIGGTACDLSFEENGTSFRATRDFDIVLIVEALTKEFGERFWEFVEKGRYRNRAASSGKPQFYRFDKPETEGYPTMLELFSRADWELKEVTGLTPIYISEEVSSLSAILLDDSYYQALITGRDLIQGISVLKPEWLIPFKAKAWLDLRRKANEGEKIDSRDIKKHRNDILRIISELVLTPCSLPEGVLKDMVEFYQTFFVTDLELKNLNLRGVKPSDIKRKLQELYHL